MAEFVFPMFAVFAILAAFVAAKVFAEARLVRPHRVAAYASPQLGDRLSFPFANGKARGTICEIVSPYRVRLGIVHRRGERERYLHPSHTVIRPLSAVTRL